MRLIDADKLMERLEEEQRIHVGHAAYQGGLAGAGILIAEAPTVAMGDDHITINWTPDIDRLAREVAYQGLNTFSFMGKSIREWVEIILEQTAPVWISVKDRLPTYAELRDDHVLVLFDDGTICSTEFDECIEGESIFGEWRQNFDMETLGATDSYWMPFEGVTHWMPLPKPPEDES